MGLADKERVRQVVDQHHQHRGHGGQGVLQYGLGHRGFLKEFYRFRVVHTKTSLM